MERVCVSNVGLGRLVGRRGEEDRCSGVEG